MSLKEYFPYSQVLHALSARSTKAHRFQEQQSALQLAAVYAADRAVLKQVMTDDMLPTGKSLPPYITTGPLEYVAPPRLVSMEETPVAEVEVPPPAGPQDIATPRQSDAGSLSFQNRAPQAAPEAITVEDIPEQPADAAINPVSSLAGDAETKTQDKAATTVEAGVAETPGETVADRVINDLEKLNQLKHNFEALFEANKASILLRDAALTVGAAPAEDLNRVQQSRQQRIAALVNSLDPELNGDRTLEGELDYGTSKNFLEEIKNNKQALEPVGEKQKDQLRMIDDFINIQPSVSGKDKVSSAPEDLATIKTGEFSDNIVSETLVDILIKQGKKDKAIEVLKKLIWKFPQKKAYFAAQIEDLKK